MAIHSLNLSLGDGYGISMPDVDFDKEKQEIHIPTKLRRGMLILLYDDETDIIAPGIKIDDEITFCIAFYMYHRTCGWKMVDFKDIPTTLNDLVGKMEAGTFGFHMLDVYIDMSEYEPIDAWPDAFDFDLGE